MSVLRRKSSVVVSIKTAFICALAMGALFMFLGFKAKAEKQALDERGVSVPGVITSAEVLHGSKNKKRYIIRVAWGEGTERRENEPFQVKQDFFKTKVQGETSVTSPEVVVRHLPGTPDTAIIVGGTSDLGGMEWLGYFFGLVGLIGCWKTFFGKKAVA